MQKIEKQELIDAKNLSSKYGLLAGMMMAATLLLLQFTGNDHSPLLKLGEYFLLGLSIVVLLNIYKNNFTGDIFIKGIGLGAKLSFVAGVFLVMVNYLIFFIYPDLAFSKYGIEPSSVKQVSMVSGILFFETLVFGSLITFMAVRFLKDPLKDKRD